MTNTKQLSATCRSLPAVVVAVLLTVNAGLASDNAGRKYAFEFENLVDSAQGFSNFEQFPAINNKGSVAFVAVRTGVGAGVFRARDGEVTTIAGPKDNLTSFGNDPEINASGVVVFTALTSSNSLAIFTSDGVSKKLIADTSANGLSKFGFGAPSINAAGTVAFESVTIGAGLPASIFTGNGGPLTTVLSTSRTGFGGFQNVAINDSGKIVFAGTLTNGTAGIFTVPGTPVDIVDTNTHPEFGNFGDPVINNSGTIADVAFLFTTGLEIITGNARGITPRNDPTNPPFTDSDHPSLNNQGAVAFYAFPAANPADPTGIFLEVSGGHTLIPVIRPGDRLFGSTVVSLGMGRFALNDRFELVFQYSLADGRSGIAIASFHGESEDAGD